MAILADRESRLLIDGKLVAGSAGTFPTVNPATEEVLGVAADASPDDMGAAIDAARRAFDETDWSTNVELRVRVHPPAAAGHARHVEELRELTIAEVGAPRMLTSMAQLEGPVEDLSFCADTAESYQWTTDLGIASPMGIKTHRTIAREADRRRRRDHAVELPAPDQPRQDRARAGGGQHAWCSSRRPTPRGAQRCSVS